MNRALYIGSIVLAIVFVIVGVYYSAEVKYARYDYYSSLGTAYGTYPTYNSGYYAEYSFEAGLVSLLFILFFIATDLLGLIKVKTKTAKVMSIIGLAFGGLFLFIDLAIIAAPTDIPYDDAFPAFFLYALIVLAFSVVGLVQSIIFINRKDKVKTKSSDLLDS